MARSPLRQGTAVRSTKAGQRVSWPVQMDIDMSQFIQTMRFVSAVGKQIVADEQTRNDIARALISQQVTSFYGMAKRQATQSKDSIAHVFTWEEIKEGAGKFSVVPDVSSPLFDIVKNSRRAGAVFSIKMKNNNNKALRDPRMEALAGGELAEHHFKDQASELERVAIIEKESTRLSRRRIKNPSKSSKKLSSRRIVDLDPSGSKIINRSRIRRPNQFKNNFTEFFFEFFNFQGDGPLSFAKGGSRLASNLKYVHDSQRGYAQKARSGAGFTAGRRMGGATKVTAILRNSPIVAFDEKGKPIGLVGADIAPKNSDLAAVRNAVRKTYSGSTITGAV